MGRPLRRALNFQRNLTCTITLADGRQLVTLRDAVDVLNETFTDIGHGNAGWRLGC